MGSDAMLSNMTWSGYPDRQLQVTLHDETLRDGLQSPSVVDPSLSAKIEFIRMLDQLGVQSASVGLPAAGPRALAQALALCKAIASERLSIEPCIAARTLAQDIAPAAEIAQRTGIAPRVMAFIGSSPIRIYAEGWTLAGLRKRTIAATSFAMREGLRLTYVTEDTTRSAPAVLRDLFRTAIEHGADRLCLCDTCGHATPHGALQLVQFVCDLVTESKVDVGLDWHGHNDRGLALANSLAAAAAGVDRLHGCALGIGERVGNTALEMLLVNASTDFDPKLETVVRMCSLVSRAMGRPIPAGHPLQPVRDAAQSG